MAKAQIHVRLHQSLLTDVRTMQLGAQLGIGPLYAAAHLCALWLWAQANVEADLLPGHAAVVAFAAQWPGSADVLVDAMLSAGWLATGPGGQYVLLGHTEAMQPLLARAANTRRMQAVRNTDTLPTNAPAPALLINPEVNSVGSDTNATAKDVETNATAKELTGRARERGSGGKPVSITPAARAAHMQRTAGQAAFVDEPEELEFPDDLPAAAPAKKKKKGRTVAHSYPDDFEVTAAMRKAASEKYPDLDIDAATEEWATTMQANRTKYRYTDWGMAWANSMRRAAEWQALRGTYTRGGQPHGPQVHGQAQNGARAGRYDPDGDAGRRTAPVPVEGRPPDPTAGNSVRAAVARRLAAADAAGPAPADKPQ